MNTLTTILIAVLLSVNVIILCLLLLSGLLIRQFVARLQENFKGFITAPDDKTPSRLALICQFFADMVGRSMVAQAKATFMGKQSGDTRQEKAVAGDIIEDSMSSNPITSILSSFPTLKKSIRRNPQLLDIALGLLNKNKSGGGSGSGSNNNSHYQSTFKL